MTEAQHSYALTKLILFIAGLALFGVVLALVLYFAGMMPVQQAIPGAPQNWCMSCI